MARYIDADRIDMNQVTVYDYREQKWTHVFDIPEDIVRCKDCYWHNQCRYEQYLGLDGFCAKGERRNDA